MNIEFENSRLEKCANKDSYGVKRLGNKRFRLFKRRLDQLKASESLEDLNFQPGRFKPLTANRKGTWSCDLDHPYRLVFSPVFSKDDKELVSVSVNIVEIVDYH